MSTQPEKDLLFLENSETIYFLRGQFWGTLVSFSELEVSWSMLSEKYLCNIIKTIPTNKDALIVL